MDDLPELPFEKVLSYLSLEELIKARAVSRRWYHVISSFRVKRLCYSAYPGKFIGGTSQPVSRAFAPSLIISPRFASFFNTFGRSILSNLKHLHLRDLRLNQKNRTGFARTINTFNQLEELSIINAGSHADSNTAIELELSLPMLTSVQLENLGGIKQLTLDASNLTNIKFQNCDLLKLDLVHPESVERLVTYSLEQITKKLKNLKRFYSYRIDPTLLSDLKQLKEIHQCNSPDPELFEEKQRLGRVDLKIYVDGLLLSGPDDPAVHISYRNLNDEFFGHLAENPSRLADEIPFGEHLHYSAVERVAPELAINVLRRLTRLRKIITSCPVQDVQRFLDLLKNFENIVQLEFWSEPQPQDLLDRLPEYCALQELTITCAPSDFRFLFELKQHLTILDMRFSVDIELIRRVLNELQFLAQFDFYYDEERFRVRIDQLKPSFKKWPFCVSSGFHNYQLASFPDSNAVIEHVLKFTQEEGE